MNDTARAALVLIDAIRPHDHTEADHRADAIAWLRSTDDVYRRRKPSMPSKHLVAYVVPVDPHSGRVLLVDHINACLWLPPGGHVEPGEHPATTAVRELEEELGIALLVERAPMVPSFVTVTQTVGHDAGHTDVSLWFRVELDETSVLRSDPAEMHDVRWWSVAEIATANSGFDPHFHRFLAKDGARG